MAEKKHYKGYLGDFWYDPELWTVLKKYTAVGQFEILVYCGQELDGSKIQIPDGVVNTSYMFANKGLTSTPVIPLGVHTADYMFEGNQSLTVGAALPHGLKSAAFMYKDCHSLLAGSDMPDTLVRASHMYENCYSMQMPVKLSESLESMSCLYRNCRSLTDYNHELPKSVVRSNNWLHGCKKLDQRLHPKMY